MDQICNSFVILIEPFNRFVIVKYVLVLRCFGWFCYVTDESVTLLYRTTVSVISWVYADDTSSYQPDFHRLSQQTKENYRPGTKVCLYE